MKRKRPIRLSKTKTVHSINPFNQFSKVNKIILIIFFFFILIAFGIFLFGSKLTSKTESQNVISNPPANHKYGWKTYSNNYYNFKLDIPKDWKTKEYSLNNSKTIYENDDFQTYELTSSNGELFITNHAAYAPWVGVNEYIPPNNEVQLGRYKSIRHSYLDEQGKRKDSFGLPDIKRQKVIVFYVHFKENFDKNNQTLLEILKTFAFIKQDPSLDDDLTYAIPKGWRKEDTDVARILSFVSNDFHEEYNPIAIKGAKLTVNRIKNDSTKTLLEQVTLRSSYNNSIINSKIGNTILGSNKYLNMISNCSSDKEFPCNETYSTEKDEYIWTISFECQQNCHTKAGMDSTVYAKDRDAFINSLQFK